MNTGFIFNRFGNKNNWHVFVLILVWIGGLLLGMSFALKDSSTLDGVVFTAVSKQAGIIPSFVVFVFPILATAISIHFKRRIVCVPVFLAEAISRGFTGSAISLAFGSSAWVIRLLLLLPGCCVSVVMWLIYLWNSQYSSLHFRRNIIVAVGAVTILVFINVYVVSPFLSVIPIYF